jgi:hypothetical protein
MNYDLLKKHGFQLYKPSVANDLLFFRWWAHLQQTKKFDDMFLEDSRPFGNFINLFTSPKMTVFTVDNQGEIDFAAWLTPFEIATPASFVSLWSRLTGTRRLIVLTGLFYESILSAIPNLFGVTRLQKLKVHDKIGYITTGTIQGFYPDAAGYYVHLTKKAFEESKFYPVYRKLLWAM